MATDFFDGKHPLSSWGRIKREMKIADYYFKSGEKKKAYELKKHIKREMDRFYEIYGESERY